MLRLLRLLLIGLPFAVAAQPSIQYTRLTVQNGLSNNSVQCILQDREGIVWIGTNGGLNRYDGASFIQYSMLSKPALTNGVVTALMQDADGYLWIGTENGLNILQQNTNTIQHFIHDNAVTGSFPAGVIRSIQKMQDGSTWILSDRWMLKFSNRKMFQPVAIDSTLLQQDMVFAALTAGSNKQLWISYLDHVTTLAQEADVNGRPLVQQAVYRAPDYAQVYIDAGKVTWGIACTGVSRFNETTRRFDPWLKNTFAATSPNLHLRTSYCLDADNDIWQGNDRGGLVKYVLQQKQVTDYSWLLKAINATIVYCVYKDNSNNLWVGTDNGIIRISNRTTVFSNIPFSRNNTVLKDIRCRRIVADKYYNLYAGTENYGLLKMRRLPGGRDTTIFLSVFGAKPVSDLLSDKNTLHIKLDGRYDIGYMYDLWYDGGDQIWMAGFGLGRYNIHTDSFEVFLAAGDEQERRESIPQFAVCADGKRFWTGGQYNIFTFDTVTRELVAFRDQQGKMPFYNIPCWSLGKKGEWIWAGTGKGLYKINSRTKEVIKLAIHPVLEFGINDICIDNTGCCWISTVGGGVIQYDERTGQVHQHTNKDGLSNNTVCGILCDRNNNLWISTYAGLSYFNQQAASFTSFYTRDGLNADEFNRKAFTALPDGRMIFGGLNGYTVFDPDGIFKKDRPVKMIITRFSKTNSEGNTEEQVFDIAQQREVVIEPGDKFFAFYFTLTDMYEPAGNRYRYSLQGVDGGWHDIGNQNFVSFNALPAGTYTLRIAGSPGKGAETISEVSVRIIVKQVFYKTTWFILLMLAAATAIVIAIIRYRVNQVKKIQYLRTRIASDLHDEVGSSLVHITMLADMVKRSAGNKTAMDEQLSGIAGISRGAVATMKDIIWSIDARYDTIAGMIGHMRDHVYNVLTPADIDFSFTVAGLSEQEKLPADFRQQVYLVFKEAINNVVKHAKATGVQISLTKENGSFIMEINDNGKGIDTARYSNGQGLSNMRMRAQRLKGSVDVISGNGVTIRLKVPL
ncbi:MAG: two-component regulator propeller domain-containing protein [Chitinophagaceae bacterium]